MKNLILLLLLGSYTTVALAEGGFVTLGANRVTVDRKTLGDSDTAFNGSIGYEFNPYFGAEVAYYDLGTYKSGTDALDASALGGAVIATIPFNKVFSAYGRVGIASVSSDLTLGGVKTDQDSTTGYGGIGFELRGEKASVYLEYMFFEDDSSEFEMAGLGFKIRF